MRDRQTGRGAGDLASGVIARNVSDEAIQTCFTRLDRLATLAMTAALAQMPAMMAMPAICWR
jgi:hypothetical protein